MGRILVSSGEISGDELAGAVLETLSAATTRPLEFTSLGGKHAARAGARNLLETSEGGIAGFDDLSAYQRWARLFDRTLEIVSKDPPDVFVAFAHHAFNIPLAQRLRERSGGRVRTILVAPPELWAWDVNGFGRLIAPPLRMMFRLAGSPFVSIVETYKNRGGASVRWFDRIACLFPIEARIYGRIASGQRPGHSVASIHHVGHPFYRYRHASVLEGLDRRGRELRRQLTANENQDVLSVFPGSRSSTIASVLPAMLDAVFGLGRVRDGSCALGVSVADPTLERQIADIVSARLAAAGRGIAEPTLVTRPAEELLAASSFALSTLGTITLRAACLGVPSVVAWRSSRSAAKRAFYPVLFRRGTLQMNDGRDRPTPFALPNVLAGEMVFPECVEGDFEPGLIRQRLEEQLQAEDPRQRLLEVREDLLERCLRGRSETAGERDAASCVAELVLAELASVDPG